MPDYNPYDLPGEAHNPYAPPEADLRQVDEFQPVDIVVEPFSIGAVWNRAWAIYQERMWLVMGIVIGSLALNQAVSFGLTFLGIAAFSGQMAPNTIQAVTAIPTALFSLWITIGQTAALIKIAKGENASFNDVFSGGQYYLSMFLGSLFFLGCTVGVMAGVLIPLVFLGYALAGGNPDTVVAIRLGGILFGVFGVGVVILISVRLYLYQYAIIDRGLGGFESLTYSYKVTKGYGLSLIGLFLVAGFVGISGILACGIGLLFTAPLTPLIYACAYVSLSNQPAAPGRRDSKGPIINF